MLATRNLRPCYHRVLRIPPREALMQYRTFGRTGWQVSDIGYGLWGMSGWTGSDDQQSTAALQQSVDAGVTFFDSAWAYGSGKSDKLLGG